MIALGCMNSSRESTSAIVLSALFLVSVVGLSLLGSYSALITSSVFGAGELSKTRLIRLGSSPVIADVVTSEQDQHRGLSGRDALPESRGMLFIFPKPGYYTFWMKGMKFPIDIIWISRDLRVVDVAHNLPAPANLTADPVRVAPPAPAQYVLEVRAGWARRHYIERGDLLVFTD